MTVEENNQKKAGGPGTEYEDTEAHERIGLRQNDNTQIASDMIDYGTTNASDPMTRGEE
jgi:hypothetical protein